jgi:Fe-Mn family superoxide dismutase
MQAPSFELAPLPWPADALEPVLSKGAVELHHGKHYRGYVTKLNALVEGTDFARMELEQVVRVTVGDPTRREIFNNAGQAWNHAFFFDGLKPAGPAQVPPNLLSSIKTSFGGLDVMNARLAALALERFGSGWVWLCLRGRYLELSSSANASTPLTTDAIPLLAVDVWEHAYYLDYHERREAYVKALLSTLVNWKKVAARAGMDRSR